MIVYQSTCSLYLKPFPVHSGSVSVAADPRQTLDLVWYHNGFPAISNKLYSLLAFTTFGPLAWNPLLAPWPLLLILIHLSLFQRHFFREVFLKSLWSIEFSILVLITKLPLGPNSGITTDLLCVTCFQVILSTEGG